MMYWELLKRFWPILVCMVMFALGSYVEHHHMQTKLDALQHQFDQYVADTKAQGEIAAREAAAKDKANQKRAEETNHDYQARIDSLTDDNRKLRDKDRARGSYVPKAASTPADPDTACFKRADLESAIGQLVADVQALAGKGDESIIALNTVREWAQRR